MGLKSFKQLVEIYQISRPIILVLMLAALIVFINSYPNVPEIASLTKDYRQQVKSKIDLNETEQESIKIEHVNSPSLPNTIELIPLEDVDNYINPSPETKQSPTTEINETNDTILDVDLTEKDPALEIKLLTGFLNVAPLILVAVLGGFGIYLLFKYKRHFTLQSMFGVAIALVAISTIIFLSLITFNFADFLYGLDLNIDLIVLVTCPIAFALGSWLSYNIISKRTSVFRRNMGLIFAGAMMGAFLAAFLPFWIIFILLIAISLFDIYSVKFGPIKKIMELEEFSKEKKIEKQIIYRRIENKPKAPGKDNMPSKTEKVMDINAGQVELKQTSKKSSKEVDKKQKTNVSYEQKPKDNYSIPTHTIKSDQSSHETSTNIQKDNIIRKNEITSTQLLSPSKKSVRNNDDDFDLILMFDNRDWSLGLGDFVIYSMFTSAVLSYTMLYLPYYIFYSPLLGLILPWVIFILCSLGLLVGFFITLKLLQTRDYLPGLPISIFFGFIVFISCITVLQVVNYLLYHEFAIIF